MLWIGLIFVCVIGGIFLLSAGLKYVQMLIARRTRPFLSGGIQIVDMQYIDPKTRIIALDYDGGRYLVLVSPQHASCIDKRDIPLRGETV